MSANRKPIPDHTTRLYRGTFLKEIGDRDAPRQSARLARLPPRPDGALLDTSQENESSMEEDESSEGG